MEQITDEKSNIIFNKLSNEMYIYIIITNELSTTSKFLQDMVDFYKQK